MESDGAKSGYRPFASYGIGQTKKVTVYLMISKDIIEEKILALQEEKKDLADEMILGSEEKSLMNLSSEELLELLGWSGIIKIVCCFKGSHSWKLLTGSRNETIDFILKAPVREPSLGIQKKSSEDKNYDNQQK